MKDTNNLISYSQWSCGDYNTPIDNLTRVNTAVLTINQDISTNGESSLKGLFNTRSGYFDFHIPDINVGSYTVSFDAFCPNEAVICSMNRPSELSRVTIPKNNSIQHIELVGTVNSAGELIVRFFNGFNGNFIYLDNLQLIKN